MTTLIRAMQLSDVPAALSVAHACWGKLYAQTGQPDFSDMFSSSAWRPFFYVAESDDRVIGTAGYGSSWLNYGIYSLCWIAVIPSHRRKGVGTRLIQRCVDDLSVLADQVLLVTGVVPLYERLDFRVVAPMPTIHGADDVLMVRDFGPKETPFFVAQT